MRWREGGHERAGGRALSHGQRHAVTLPLVPASVRAARVSTAPALAAFGVAPASSLTDAALLVVSELVSNAVRHAAEHSPDVEVTVAVAAGQLVIGVRDQDPGMIDLAADTTGEGLRTVAELAAANGGGVSVEPAARGRGKTILVRFQLPDTK